MAPNSTRAKTISTSRRPSRLAPPTGHPSPLEQGSSPPYVVLGGRARGVPQSFDDFPESRARGRRSRPTPSRSPLLRSNGHCVRMSARASRRRPSAGDRGSQNLHGCLSDGLLGSDSASGPTGAALMPSWMSESNLARTVVPSLFGSRQVSVSECRENSSIRHSVRWDYSGVSPASSTRMMASPSGRFGASTSRTMRLLFFDLRR